VTFWDRVYEKYVQLGRFLDSLRSLPPEGIAEIRFPHRRALRFKLFVPTSPGAGRELYLHHRREPFSTVVFHSMLYHYYQYSVVYEIGANLGYYLIPEVVLSRYVYAYEPQSQLTDYIVESIDLNGLSTDNLSLFDYAVWPGGGTVRMDIPERHNFARVSDSGSVEVPAVDPSELPEPSGDAVFLRMDIEGGEEKVLLPLVNRFRPAYVFVEVHPNIIGPDKAYRLVSRLDELFGYWILPIFEPLPETLDLPFYDVVYKHARIGPVSYLRTIFHRGWVVHIHAFRWRDDFEYVRQVLSRVGYRV